MADDFQKDFFGDQFYEKKGRKPHLLERYYRQRFLPHIKIPIEYTVISAIAILVLMVISYAVGVERGKRISVARPAEAQETASVAEEQVLCEITDKDLPEAEPKEEEPPPETTEKPDKEEAERKVPAPVKATYVVQLASFKNERSAKKEINMLKSRGIEAHMTKKGEWYQVYASGYRTIDEAKRARRELITDYEDCYIRKVN